MKKLLKKLIEAESTQSTGELAVAEIISDELKHSKIKCRIDKWEKNRANIIARMNGKNKKGLLFACHIDVVPAGQGWDSPPFKAVEKNGRIFGRGSTDMKGGIAAIVTAIRQIADSGVRLNGDIILVGTALQNRNSYLSPRPVCS